MSESLTPAGTGAAVRDRTHTLFAQTMGCVAITAALFAFGAYLGRHLDGGLVIFVHIPGGALIYAVLGLVIFAGFTMFGFQRLRRSQDVTAAPMLAASIFVWSGMSMVRPRAEQLCPWFAVLG